MWWCQRNMTHREYTAWLEHLKEPDPHDLYIMQLTEIVKHLMSNRKQINPYDSQLDFGGPKPHSKMGVEQATMYSKLTWGRRLGLSQKQLQERIR